MATAGSEGRTPREVRVADRVYTLEPFRGSKGVRATKLVSSIMRQARPVLVEWRAYDNEYRQTNSTVITRELAELRAAQAVIDEAREAWERVLKGPLAERESITIPATPSFETKLAEFFPAFLEAAEDDVIRLLALIVAPNDDLREWRKAGTIDERLREFGDDLLDALDLDELALLAADGLELLNTQLRGVGERLGELRALVQGTLETGADRATTTAADGQPDTRDRTMEVGGIDEEELSRRQTPSNGDSSTDSPAPTDGPSSESSSENAGTTSAPSRS